MVVDSRGRAPRSSWSRGYFAIDAGGLRVLVKSATSAIARALM